MTTRFDRRHFLGTTLAAGSCTVVPRTVLGGPGHVPPSERIQMAHIGMGTQGFKELGVLLADPRVQIVAVCDPNRQSTDYVEWGKGGVVRTIRKYLDKPDWRAGLEDCPGGREVGRDVVETYYALHRGQEKYRGCKAYADFRELFAQETDIDAVKIMTPDHHHATIAIAAMKQGVHVAMHKPIANRLAEGRLVLQTARQTGCQTHLLAYGSGAGNERIARAVAGGVIGTLREIHNWTNRPVWPQYPLVSTDRPPIPAGFDWQLWLGPEKDRPYHPHYTHTVFRGWYDFGGGSMADMGIYSLWPVLAGLDLPSPSSAQATATHTCNIENYVSRRVSNDYSYPTACTLRFHFDARGDRAPVDLFWYDGGMKPRLPEALEAQDVEVNREGILYVGSEGCILAGFRGSSPVLFSGGKQRPLALEEGPELPENTIELWLDACRGGATSPGSFLSAAEITDTVNLGTVALRAQEKVVFDADAMKITNSPAANRYLKRDYRPGWELPDPS